MKIYESAAYVDLKINNSYFKLYQYSMWDIKPTNTIIFKRKCGNSTCSFSINKETKITKSTYKSIPLKISEITQEMKDYLTEKGYTYG